MHGESTVRRLPRTGLLEAFSHALRLAERLPAGASKDHVHRAICELIEVRSSSEQNWRVERLLNSLFRLTEGREPGATRVEPALVNRLLGVLQPEVVPMLRPASSAKTR